MEILYMNRIVKGVKIWYRGVVGPFELIQDNFGSLVGFSATFRLLSFFVLFPILAWTERLWLLTNKTTVIAWYNIGSFIKNPSSWIVLLLMAAILVAATMFEQFAIYDALHASRSGMKRSLRQIYSAGFDMSAERLKLENWTFIPYAILVLRFGTITGDVSSVINVIKIPGFILEDFTKRPWEGYLYLGFQIIMIYLFIRWIFAIPIMMEEDGTSFPQACRKSALMTKGTSVLRVGFVAIGWAALIWFFYYAGAAVIVAIWFLLSMWLLPGETEPFPVFFLNRFGPTGTIFYIFFLWIVTPLIAASFQSLYYIRKQEMSGEILPYTEAPHFFHRYPLLKWLIVAICAVSLFFSGPRRFAQIRWMLNTNYGTPMIMAHRGFSAKAPENTLPAFQACIDGGFSAAELDVQMTADGTIIVLHDDNLKRTTGLDKNVWEVTYDEIRDLDNGSFFSKEFADTNIPTLDEVIKLAASGKDNLFLNIEIKRNGHDDGIVEKVVDIIVQNDYLNNCDVTSQDYSTLQEVREVNPAVLTAYTSVVGIGRIESLEAADIISIQETFATYENVERIHDVGKRVFVWTVNEEETMKNLISLNVDAILTNDPELCKSVLDQYSSDMMNMLQRIHSAFEFL